MVSRRDFLQVVAATAALLPHGWTRALAQQRLTQQDLLRFDSVGNVSLVHIADLHAQLVPVLLREPSVNLGVGDASGTVPHVTGRAFLDLFKIAPGSAAAYALTAADFSALANSYGRLGGLDRIATILKTIRAERGDRVVFLDGGDTWQNSYTSLKSRGQDMVDCMALLKPDAMVGHWEFTLGADRVKELAGQLGFAFLAQNMRDAEWNEAVFEPMVMLDRGGIRIAVIGQAFPYTPIANPRWLMPSWSFGIREDDIRTNVEKARRARSGAGRPAVAQRLRCRSQAGGARPRHRRHPDRTHPRRAAGCRQGRQDAARCLRQPRQIRVPTRSRCARWRDQGLSFQAHSGIFRRHRAGARDGGENPQRAGAA